MVSGDNVANVGDCIGYIGNAVDGSDLTGSAIRSSFVLDWLWLPIVIVYAALGISESESGLIADLSRARGVSGFVSIVRAFMCHAVLITVLYSLSTCAVSLIFAVKIGVSMGASFWMRLSGWMLANVLLLLVQYAEAACTIRFIGSSSAGSVLVLMTALLGTAFYPSLASSGDSLARLLLLFPSSRFLSTCALSERHLTWGDQILFCIFLIAILCVIDTGVCSIRRRFR